MKKEDGRILSHFRDIYAARLNSVSHGEKIMSMFSNYSGMNPRIDRSDSSYPDNVYNTIHTAVTAWYAFYRREIGEFKVSSAGLAPDDEMVMMMEDEFNRVEHMCGINSLLDSAIISYLCAGEANLAFFREHARERLSFQGGASA